ncbi:MAG: hypothetical protein KatS3mg076_1730 [Candidatus Binatia bacterium]|nr:MAG: hypothetical protein KatS3mg076_1730 [Candidatus Binatia bacterium]
MLRCHGTLEEDGGFHDDGANSSVARILQQPHEQDRRKMPHPLSRPVPTTLLKVGIEVLPVYGDEESGWSMEAEDLAPHTPRAFRYGTLDELFFALVNLNVTEEGEA